MFTFGFFEFRESSLDLALCLGLELFAISFAPVNCIKLSSEIFCKVLESGRVMCEVDRRGWRCCRCGSSESELNRVEYSTLSLSKLLFSFDRTDFGLILHVLRLVVGVSEVFFFIGLEFFSAHSSLQT